MKLESIIYRLPYYVMHLNKMCWSHYNCNCLGFYLFFTRLENAFGEPFPVDTIIFRLTCGFTHISLSDSAHWPADRLCWSFILKSSPHMIPKETKRFIFPLTLRGLLPAEKFNVIYENGPEEHYFKNFLKIRGRVSEMFLAEREECTHWVSW